MESRSKDIRIAWRNNPLFKEAIIKLSSICNNISCQCEACPINKYCNFYISKRQQKITKTNFVITDSNGKVVAKKFVLASLPGEMQVVEVDGKSINSDITISVEGL